MAAGAISNLNDTNLTFNCVVLTPFAMNYLEKRGTLCRYPWITIPVQCGLLAICLTFATPMCCAFFKQKSEIEVCKLEPELQVLKKKSNIL